MAKVAITEQYLEDIADAIREKTGLSSATFLPSQMAPAILTISGGGGIIPTGTLNITSNNTYDVTQYATAVVNVPTGSTINNQNKIVTPNETEQSITFDNGYTGLGIVTVGAISSTYIGSGIPRRVYDDIEILDNDVIVPLGYYDGTSTVTVPATTHPKPTLSINSSTGIVTASHAQTTGYVSAGTTTETLQLSTQAAATITPTKSEQTAVAANKYTIGIVKVGAIPASYIIPSGNKSITANGTNIDVAAYSTVSVNVSGGGATINNQDKSVAPTESQQVVTYDSGYTGLESVTVEAISSTYIGSGITQRSSTDLSASGATVTVPAGYYSSQATKSVSSMTLPTSAAASATSGYTSKATISRSTSDQYINIAPGYNSAGGYYKISAVANGSATGPSSLSGSSATISTGTNTITLTKTGISTTPTVSAGYVSSATSSTATVALTASVAVNPTPTASGKTVTIPAGYYTAQTTKDVSTGSTTAPASISGSSATVSTGTNTITLSKTISVTPTVSAGYISSGTAGNSSVSLTASVTTKAATTYHPSTTAQSISSGTYLTGAQTINAVTTSNLSASNIVSGVTIKVGDSSDDDCVASVTGSVVLQNYYTGSSAPTASLGQDGDLYLQQ